MTTDTENADNKIGALMLRAKKYHRTARILVDVDDYESSVSRTYYAMFYAAEAALLSKDLTQSTHTGIHRLFGEHFVKTGIFPASMGKNFSRAFSKRQLGDYDVDLSLTAEEALQLWETSTIFIQTIGDYLREQGFLETFTVQI